MRLNYCCCCCPLVYAGVGKKSPQFHSNTNKKEEEEVMAEMLIEKLIKQRKPEIFNRLCPRVIE
jgi:hypothetical protein